MDWWLGGGIDQDQGSCDECFNNRDMAVDTTADFFCAHCDAGYKVVRVEAELVIPTGQFAARSVVAPCPRPMAPSR
jgi:hypothetical protein